MESGTCFSALCIDFLFSALDAGYMFSRAWHRLHVFPRLPPVTCFPALGTGHKCSRAWHRFDVFACFPPTVYFPALFGVKCSLVHSITFSFCKRGETYISENRKPSNAEANSYHMDLKESRTKSKNQYVFICENGETSS